MFDPSGSPVIDVPKCLGENPVHRFSPLTPCLHQLIAESEMDMSYIEFHWPFQALKLEVSTTWHCYKRSTALGFGVLRFDL